MKHLLKKIERLMPFLIVSAVLFFLLIGSHLSMLVFYFLIIVLSVFLLMYMNRRRKNNLKISLIFFFLSIVLTIFGSIDFISELLMIISKNHAEELRSFPHKLHNYDSFFGFLAGILLGIILVSTKIKVEMGWLKGDENDSKIAKSLKRLKILGTIVIVVGFVAAARTIYIYAIAIPGLENYESKVQNTTR